MIKDVFDELIKQEYFTRIKHYKFTMQSMGELVSMKKRSIELLFDLLKLVKKGSKEEDLYLDPNHEAMGFNSRSNYHKYLNELITRGFIHRTDKGYLIDFCKVNYLSRRQLEGFYEVKGLKKTLNVNLGQQ